MELWPEVHLTPYYLSGTFCVKVVNSFMTEVFIIILKPVHWFTEQINGLVSIWQGPPSRKSYLFSPKTPSAMFDRTVNTSLCNSTKTIIGYSCFSKSGYFIEIILNCVSLVSSYLTLTGVLHALLQHFFKSVISHKLQ